MAFIRGYASSGSDPAIMGIGPVRASRKALAKAGWTPQDLDLIEANEAFAAQAVAVNREMGWDLSQGKRERWRGCARASDWGVRREDPHHAALRNEKARRQKRHRNSFASAEGRGPLWRLKKVVISNSK